MGLIQWLTQRSLTPGEAAVDRRRKELVAPMFPILGFLNASWILWTGFSLGSVESDTKRAGGYVLIAAMAIFAGALLPAGLYVVATRKVSANLCQYPVLACAVAVLVNDVANLLQGAPSIVSVNVVLLDCLLLCACDDRFTTAVVVITAVWIPIRSVLEWEKIPGVAFCGPERFSAEYIDKVANSIVFRMIVLLVDFKFTRGFARSMHQQKAMVQASIEVTEVAAVHLSEYETDVTQTLLEGPDGERLPSGLREALLQLVANLALYRPFLPQSCLPGREDAAEATAAGESTMSDGCSGGVPSPGTTPRRQSMMPARRRQSGSQASGSDIGKPHGPGLAEIRNRNVSMLAVNSKNFLRSLRDSPGISDVRGLVHTEVEAFAGEVADGTGVVDIVSGDHMFANFNASRLCASHRLSAVRVAWAMAKGHASNARRTACVCGGSVLCGDFGTSEVRRFMLLGPTYNTMQALERVAANLFTVLVDQVIGADAEVEKHFLRILAERLCFAKRGPRPFLVWHLAGQRSVDNSPSEWMYELMRQAPDPYEDWNSRLLVWLNFGAPLDDGDIGDAMPVLPTAGMTRAREQSYLTEATVVGDTLAFHTSMRP
eukprot:TRINITY_DN4880_c0_g1_i2.p1 TRINITY_DN4880_c0_g1~~TRINITY_DN4880_c0_g1_i2.p1  ORF type:complete len:602 (+),score=81.15 TRINITY_DN4880_c0_g1_i2:78-1883(+)